MKSFVLFTWLMWFRRLMSPTICSQKAGHRGELLFQFQSESKGLRPRRSSGGVPVRRLTALRHRVGWFFSLSPKAGKSWCPGSKAARQEEFSLTLRLRVSFFVLFRPSTGWVRVTILGGTICFTQSTDIHVSLIQEHPEMPGVMFDQSTWAPSSTVKLKHKNCCCISDSNYFVI